MVQTFSHVVVTHGILKAQSKFVSCVHIHVLARKKKQQKKGNQHKIFIGLFCAQNSTCTLSRKRVHHEKFLTAVEILGLLGIREAAAQRIHWEEFHEFFHVGVAVVPAGSLQIHSFRLHTIRIQTDTHNTCTHMYTHTHTTHTHTHIHTHIFIYTYTTAIKIFQEHLQMERIPPFGSTEGAWSCH